MIDRIKNYIFRKTMLLFMPKVAKQMQIDGTFDLDPEKMPEHIRIVDNNADVTIFLFAGLDVLFAGLARFEFGRLLRTLGKESNFVFLRDIRRSAYHTSPDGEPNGLEFFEKVVREAKEQLGAKHNIALGSSSGGGAALYFGSKCNMQHLIIFGPAEPVRVYTHLWSQVRIFCDIKKLITDFKAYCEVAMVAIGAMATIIKIGMKNWWPVVETYRDASPRPYVTFFYGERCGPDSRSAKIFSQFPEVDLRPLPTGRHNSPDCLQEKGELGRTLTGTIRNGIERAKP